MKGGIPEAANTRELSGLRAVTQKIWLVRSVWPLDWEWEPDERLTTNPRVEQKDLHMGPCLQGIPCTGKTWSTRRAPIPPADGSLDRGTK